MDIFISDLFLEEDFLCRFTRSLGYQRQETILKSEVLMKLIERDSKFHHISLYSTVLKAFSRLTKPTHSADLFAYQILKMPLIKVVILFTL